MEHPGLRITSDLGAVLSTGDADATAWFAHAPLPMWVYDLLTLAFLDVNEAAVVAYGWSAEEFREMTILDIRPAGDQPKLLESVGTRPGPFEDSGVWTHLTKAGESRYVHVFSHLIDFRGQPAALVGAFDLTAGVVSERRVRAQFELGELALTNSLEGFLDAAPMVIGGAVNCARVSIHLASEGADMVGLVEQSVQATVPLVINDPAAVEQLGGRWGHGKPANLAVVPVLRGETIAAILVASDKVGRFGDVDADTLATLGDLVVHMVDRVRADAVAARAGEQFVQATWSAIRVIARVTEARDPYTAGHQRRVARLAVDIGRCLGLPAAGLDGLHAAGLLHDVGKIALPSEVLLKPAGLSNQERELVRTHAAQGAKFLAGIEFPWPVQRAVLQHHERLDGSGYPNGLQGEEICLEGRVIAVADVADAMASLRPYRLPMDKATVIAELEAGAATLFDPDVVVAAIEVLRCTDTLDMP